MIKTQKITSTNDKPVNVDDYTTINVLKWNNSKWKYLCPYYLKTDGQEKQANPGGIIFENFYQGSKVYNTVRPIEVYPSRYQQGDPKYLWWKYTKTVKLTNPFNLEAYLEWRDSLWSCPNPIRYPNGFANKHDASFSLIIDSEGNHTQLDYIAARKELYVKEYIRLIKQTSQYTTLLNMLKAGKNIMICEVDVPDNITTMTIELLEQLMNERKSFGHGLCLAYSLLSELSHQPAQ